MTDYPQIFSAEKFSSFLKSIPTRGIPDAVDNNYLKTLGYKSSYDKKFIPALKFIGLVEDKRGGGPTDLWREFRGNPGAALAKGIQRAYPKLYSFYLDAHLRDDEALRTFFTANSSGSKDDVSRMLVAFRVQS